MELAHQLYQTRYKKKKCNFVQHWLELRREPKWRSQSTQGGGSKRTKISASGAHHHQIRKHQRERIPMRSLQFVPKAPKLWRPPSQARPDPVGGSEPKPRGLPAEAINQIRLSNTFHSQIFCGSSFNLGQAHKHLHIQ